MGQMKLELQKQMLDSHPDKGGTTEGFIAAKAAYDAYVHGGSVAAMNSGSALPGRRSLIRGTPSHGRMPQAGSMGQGLGLFSRPQPEACDTLPTGSTYVAGHAGCAVSMLLEVIAAGGAEKRWACSTYDPELEGKLTAALRHVHAALGKDAQDGACSSMHTWQPSPAQLAMLAAWIRQLPPSAVETAMNDHNRGVQGSVILQLLDCLHGPCWLHGVHWCLLVLRGMVRSLAGNPCTLLMGTADMSEAAELVRGQGSETGLQDEVDVFRELESLL